MAKKHQVLENTQESSEVRQMKVTIITQADKGKIRRIPIKFLHPATKEVMFEIAVLGEVEVQIPYGIYDISVPKTVKGNNGKEYHKGIIDRLFPDTPYVNIDYFLKVARK